MEDKHGFLLGSFYRSILDRLPGSGDKNILFFGAPGWRSRLSVRLQPGHDLAVREFEPRVGLWADGSEPRAWSLFPILCLPLSLPLPHSWSVSLCPKNK